METKVEISQSKYFRFSRLEGNVEIGRASLFLINNKLHEKPYGLLEDVFVAEKYREQGIAMELVREVIKEAQRQECYKLIVFCTQNLIGLYEKLEFERVEELEFRMGFK